MGKGQTDTRALFLSPDGTRFPDWDVCGNPEGQAAERRPCPHSDAGRMPWPRPLGEVEAGRNPERGRRGEYAPPCALQHFGNLKDWQGPAGQHPESLYGLRVFRCRKWFLLVVPGLRDERADAFGRSP